MRRLFAVLSVLCLSVSQYAAVHLAHAEAATTRVVISQLSTGDSQSGNNEFVELYNNSLSDVDISNWCIRYSTAADSLQSSPKYCFTPSDVQTKVYLATHGYAIIVTPSYVMPSGTSPDGRFTGSGMAATGGHIKLFGADGALIDKVGWGTTATAAETQSSAAPSAVQSLTRKSLDAVYQDTDNNKNDFELKTPLLHGGGVYELRTPVDICGNLGDIQEAMPAGYGYDEAGNCEALANDVCTNIDKIQLIIPDGMQQGSDGSCTVPPLDICLNLDGLQVIVPQGYVRIEDNCMRLEDRALWLSEIVPNVSGSDTGHEYIELYNPYDEPIVLNGYTLQIGKSFENSYALPSLADRVVIAPHSYITYSDSELGTSLLNTYSGVRLVAPAGNTVSETAYSDPGDDEAWAYIDGQWQYTNQSTPAAPNEVSSVADDDVSVTANLAPCPAGKYRNPLTNRCRNVEADAAILTDCQDGYYRNPETNRCRKVLAATATLTPCQEGYSRNPETNRCRKNGAADSTLTPCKAGQERNPTTNRCRNVSVLATPASVAAAEDQSKGSPTLPIAIAIATLGTVGYGVYEWRHELAGFAGGMLRRFKK